MNGLKTLFKKKPVDKGVEKQSEGKTDGEKRVVLEHHEQEGFTVVSKYCEESKNDQNHSQTKKLEQLSNREKHAEGAPQLIDIDRQTFAQAPKGLLMEDETLTVHKKAQSMKEPHIDRAQHSSRQLPPQVPQQKKKYDWHEIQQGLAKKNQKRTLRQIMTYHVHNISKPELRDLKNMLRDENFDLLYKPSYHGFLWLKASGALGLMKTNKGYYETLKNNIGQLNYPNPQFNQIEIDLRRTYPSQKNLEKMERDIGPLRNVLHCYVLRNPEVGYCQGMNFIAARLLSCQKEEEAFWTLCQLIESLLPLDYYGNLLGVLVDHKVLQHLLVKRFPKLVNHMAECEFTTDLVAFQWLVLLFVNSLPQETELFVWDMFFVSGITVLFKVALAVISLMQGAIMEATRFDEIYRIIENYGKEHVTKDLLLKNLNKQQGPTLKEIEDLRKLFRAQIKTEIQEQLAGGTQIKIMYPRIRFINRFYSFTGLSKYYQGEEQKYPDNELIKKSAAVISQTMEKIELELMDIYNCDSEWPICLYDFCFKNQNPNTFSFTVKDPLQSYIIDDYFSKDWDPSHSETIVEQSLGARKSKLIKIVPKKQTEYKQTSLKNELTLGRFNASGHHLCNSPAFVKNFKDRFMVQDPILFDSECLEFDIDNENEIIDKFHRFKREIEQPLPTLLLEKLSKIQQSRLAEQDGQSIGADINCNEESKSDAKEDHRSVLMKDILKDNENFLEEHVEYNQNNSSSHHSGMEADYSVKWAVRNTLIKSVRNQSLLLDEHSSMQDDSSIDAAKGSFNNKVENIPSSSMEYKLLHKNYSLIPGLYKEINIDQLQEIAHRSIELQENDDWFKIGDTRDPVYNQDGAQNSDEEVDQTKEQEEIQNTSSEDNLSNQSCKTVSSKSQENIDQDQFAHLDSNELEGTVLEEIAFKPSSESHHQV